MFLFNTHVIISAFIKAADQTSPSLFIVPSSLFCLSGETVCFCVFMFFFIIIFIIIIVTLDKNE